MNSTAPVSSAASSMDHPTLSIGVQLLPLPELNVVYTDTSDLRRLGSRLRGSSQTAAQVWNRASRSRFAVSHPARNRARRQCQKVRYVTQRRMQVSDELDKRCEWH